MAETSKKIKQEIRKRILTKRNNLSKKWAINKSKLIHRHLVTTKEFKRAKTIMLYLTKDNEVDTKTTIELALKRHKTVCAPCINRNNNRLYPRIIKNLKKDLVKGCFGVFEPHKKAPKPKKIDLIIIPGIAFDINGHRLGWGKAYYDKFLKNIGNIPKIGLAFDFQIVNKLPVDSHDIPINKVITERRIINFK